MRPRESTTAWLPTSDQIMAAPERAAMAALDMGLELVVRVLKAEHADLRPDGRCGRDPNWEPFTRELLPLAETVIVCAEHLQHLLHDYRQCVDGLLGDADEERRGEDEDRAF
jgi:hypothetical protein